MLSLAILPMIFSSLVAASSAARAQDAAFSEQQRLFQRMVREPTNYDATFEFVRVATANEDYEAAIGALERLLYYEPSLTRVKYELGILYFRLRSFEMAKHYFTEALKSPDLDPVTRERIATYLPDADKMTQASRFSGFLQTGVRYQSNANFSPNSGAIRLGGVDLALLPVGRRQPDWNVFGILGLSHDYDFQNQRGDLFETRFTGYATHQFKLTDLDVALFDISAGPRLMIAPEMFPGLSIKPYAVGGNAWVGGRSYVGSAGAGVTMDVPVFNRLAFVPGFEWRSATVNTGDIIPVTGFGSGNWYSPSLGVAANLTSTVKLEGSALYREGRSAAAFQSFRQWEAQAALTFEFAPPFAYISRNWSIAPFARYIRTDFNAPNPAIDPFVTEIDRQWVYGAMFNTPLWRNVAVSTTVQFDQTKSTLPNYSQHNFSVMTGPSVRF
jgi:tetratricopeptide (TPR) repeat protein